MPLGVYWKSKSAIKFEKKQSAKQKAAKTSPKNKQISFTTSPKTSNPQAFKETRNSTKNKPNFAGKPQGWQHCTKHTDVTFHRVDACYHWLTTKHIPLFLVHSIWHDPNWDKAPGLHAWNFTPKPSIQTSPTRNFLSKKHLLNISAPENLIAHLWYCCQLPVHPQHQPLQLSNPAHMHLIHNHQAATSSEMPGLNSSAWGLVLANLPPTWKHWACAFQICASVARCRLHTTYCMVAPDLNLCATSML